MALHKMKKSEIVKTFGKNDTDTGSSQVQIAILTEDINLLTEHLKKHHKDISSKRGLLKKVSRRKVLLGYLKRTNEELYQNTIKMLDLRK